MPPINCYFFWLLGITLIIHTLLCSGSILVDHVNICHVFQKEDFVWWIISIWSVPTNASYQFSIMFNCYQLKMQKHKLLDWIGYRQHVYWLERDHSCEQVSRVHVSLLESWAIMAIKTNIPCVLDDLQAADPSPSPCSYSIQTQWLWTRQTTTKFARSITNFYIIEHPTQKKRERKD